MTDTWGRRTVIFICCCPPQEAEIDSIHQLVVGATENIKEGNEDIREVGTLGPESDSEALSLTRRHLVRAAHTEGSRDHAVDGPVP